MIPRSYVVLLLLVLAAMIGSVDAQRNITFPFLHWGTTEVGSTVISSGVALQQAITAAYLARDYFNSHITPLIPEDVSIQLEVKDHGFVVPRAISYLIDWWEKGNRIIIGNPLTDVLVQTGLFGNVYGVAQISATAAGSLLTDKNKYPWMTRLVSSTSSQAAALYAAILHYSEQSEGGPIGWDRVAIIGTTDSYSVELCKEMIRLCEESGQIEVVTYQQLLRLAGVINFDVSVEVNELKKSGCRVILNLGFYGWQDVILEAVKQEIVGEHYVWMASGSTASLNFYQDIKTLEPIPLVVDATRGAFASAMYAPPTGDTYNLLIDLWNNADPGVYIGAGPTTVPTGLATLYFDMMMITAQVVTQLDKEGLLDKLDEVDCVKWSQLYRNVTLEYGASGSPVEFTDQGERIAPLSVRNWRPESLKWETVAFITNNGSFNELTPPIWYDNTTTVPDLDIRPAFDYWSCKHKEKRTDNTGKTINRQTPDGDDVDYIDEDYHCDQYIDCHNMSDETTDCSTNYIIVYVIFGVLAGVMIIVCLLLIVFVVVFGWIIRRKRLRAASPLFLLIMIVASIFGLSSIYAWFGKPHPVACGFQPWLLGLGVSALITALFSRCLRIWRIFTFPMNQTRITNVELFFFWIVTMIPAIIILVVWFIVSTPTATMKERDGREHYVCETGGFTGPPGGLVFFFIFVGYNGLLALVSAALTIATRNVPSLFNETRLLAITVYNLIFLAAIVIPTVIVLIELDYPFVAWIIRTVAIWYAFTATLALQFVPKIVGLVILDRCKDLTVRQINLVNRSSSSSNTADSRPSGSAQA